jgi:methyl-galactoside transport system substrate-binding protein
MKRLTIFLAALALLAVSCAHSDKHKPGIGLALRSFDAEDSVAMRKAMETAALDKAELAIIDGQNQQSTQDKQAEALLDRGLGAIAVDPVDPSALDRIIDKAKARKVPIVFFGPAPSGELMLSWDKVFYVGTRSEDVRTAQGELLAAYWRSDPAADRNKDGILMYASLVSSQPGKGAPPQPNPVAKALGAAGIRSEQLETVVAGDDQARKATAGMLARIGDRVDALVCDDDDEALAAIDALKAAGFQKGKKRVAVVGAHSGEIGSQVVTAIQAGSLLGTAAMDPSGQGKAVFDLAYSLARGNPPWRSGWKITDAKYIWVPCEKVTKETLAARK